MERSRLVVAVLHNNDLNQVTWELRAMAGAPKFVESQTLPDVDYARFAASLDLQAIHVDKPEDVGPAWERAFAADRPTVLDVRTDPNVPPIPPHATFEQIKGVAEAMLKGDENALGVIRTGRFERTLSALTAAGAVITAAEIWLEHDSASFGNKMMWWPIVIVPTLAPAGVAAVFSRRAAKTVLPVASAIVVANGLQGTYLHWRGIMQKPGGWHNLRYNAEMGPPAFAPLLAAMVGGMGLLAAVLRREED